MAIVGSGYSLPVCIGSLHSYNVILFIVWGVLPSFSVILDMERSARYTVDYTAYITQIDITEMRLRQHYVNIRHSYINIVITNYMLIIL